MNCKEMIKRLFIKIMAYHFVCKKYMLEPMLPLVTCLQGKLAEVYFGFQKIDEITICTMKPMATVSINFYQSC